MDHEDFTTPEHERTFAPQPPAHGRGFARTWWGRSWLKALEDTALEADQLRSGRALARSGAVGAVTVRPGRITGVVRDRDGTAHRADVLLQQFSGDEWDQFLEVTVDRAGHLAALLDHDMPPDLVEDAAAAGVELLPGIGDLEPECDCGAWDQCGHTAALSYQVGRILDQGPFALLLLRGRGEREVLAAVQDRTAARVEPTPAGAPREDVRPGVDAVEAFATGYLLPPLPGLPPVPEPPRAAPSLGGGTSPSSDLLPNALEFLALQTAREARRLLVESLSSDLGARLPLTEPPLAQDAVRLAAGEPDEDTVMRLASASGRTPDALALAVRAWRYGGAGAVSALERAWTPTHEEEARARAVVAAAWEAEEAPPLHGKGGAWTTPDGRARIGVDGSGRWWPFRREEGRWAPAGPAADDPATALAVARGED
ncbi:SWF or SNF family helicase [Streptomyces sp. NPDC049906]|uniref:SWIM zinc finger family protein n=1 Tax=Streptomyces sp. NPDC049906 TaxID=3155656 RepID=UPI003428623E